MTGVVVFDPEAFKSAYPEFEKVPDAKLEEFFGLACLLLNNTEHSVVKDLDERRHLLWLLVAHIATLDAMGGGAVGITTSATQGSVNASISPMANPKWFQLTNYGNIFWLATWKYRRGVRWYPGC